MANSLINFMNGLGADRDILSRLLARELQPQFTPHGLPVDPGVGLFTPSTMVEPATPDVGFMQPPATAQQPPMPQFDQEALEAPQLDPNINYLEAGQFLPTLQAGIEAARSADPGVGLLDIISSAAQSAASPNGFSMDMRGGGASGEGGKPVPASLAGRAKAIYDGLRKRGFDHKLAIGTLANLRQESGLDPTAHNPDEDANGLMQWRGERWARGVSLARATNRSPFDLENQLDLIALERQGPEAGNWAKAEQASTIEDATAAIDRHVERSSGQHLGNRISYARGFSELFPMDGDDVAPTGATGNLIADNSEVPERAGFFEGLGDYFRGDSGPNDYDYSTMFGILSRGLSAMSRGSDYDVGDLLQRQDIERRFQTQQAQQARERAAAAGYLQSIGRSDLAAMISQGGLGLGDAMDIENRDFQRGVAQDELDAEAASKEAMREAIMNRYGDVPGFEDMVSQLASGADPEVVAEAWNLDTDPLRDQHGSGDVPDKIEMYEYYRDQELAAGRDPLSFNEWDLQPTKQEVTTIEGVNPADANTVMSRGQIAIDTIDRALENVSAWTTGLMSLAGIVPGTAQHQLQQQLNTIKAGIGFTQLRALREASKSGASGLGQLTEKELDRLERLWGSLEASQTPAELEYNLYAVRAQYAQSLRSLKAQAEKDGVNLSDYGIDTDFLDAPTGATEGGRGTVRTTKSGLRWSY